MSATKRKPQEVPDSVLSQHETRIRRHWMAAAKGFLAIGQELAKAKAEVGHGRFEPWVRAKLPFSVRTAERFMAIAENEILANPTHESYLPPAWTTLYELSKLPKTDLEQAFSQGKVSPDMGRAEVAKLRSSRGEPKTATPKVPVWKLLERVFNVLQQLDEQEVDAGQFSGGDVEAWLDRIEYIGSTLKKLRETLLAQTTASQKEAA